jgi:tetratricopeptide (TPR) repeat protein
MMTWLLAAGYLLSEERNKRRIVIALSMVLMSACLMVTFSLGAFFGLGCGLAVLGILVLKDRDAGVRQRARHWFIVMLLSGAGIVAFYCLPNPLNGRATTVWDQAMSSPDWLQGMKTRRLIWRSTLAMIRDHPFRGVGSGNFKRVYLDYQGDILAVDPDASSGDSLGKNDTAHNEFLHVTAESGVLGLAAFLGVLLVVLRTAVRQQRVPHDPRQRVLLAGSVAAMTAVLADGLVNFPLYLPATSVLFWFLAGITSLPEDSAAGNRAGNISPIRSVGGRVVLYAAVLWIGAGITSTLIGNACARRGSEQFYRQDMQASLDSFLTAVHWNRNDQKSNLFAGAIYVAAGDYERGIPYLQRSLLGGGDMRAYLYLAQAFVQRGDVPQAIVQYQKAIHLNPYLAEPYRRVAQLYQQSNNAAMADRCYAQARELESRYSGRGASIPEAYERIRRR